MKKFKLGEGENAIECSHPRTITSQNLTGDAIRTYHDESQAFFVIWERKRDGEEYFMQFEEEELFILNRAITEYLERKYKEVVKEIIHLEKHRS